MLAREVWADFLPGMTAVGSPKHHVRRVIERVRICRRKYDRLGTVSAIFFFWFFLCGRVLCSFVFRFAFGGFLPARGRKSIRNRCYVFDLPGAPVETRDFAAAGAIDDVMIKRIGGDIAILDHP